MTTVWLWSDVYTSYTYMQCVCDLWPLEPRSLCGGFRVDPLRGSVSVAPPSVDTIRRVNQTWTRHFIVLVLVWRPWNASVSSLRESMLTRELHTTQHLSSVETPWVHEALLPHLNPHLFSFTLALISSQLLLIYTEMRRIQNSFCSVSLFPHSFPPIFFFGLWSKAFSRFRCRSLIYQSKGRNSSL